MRRVVDIKEHIDRINRMESILDSVSAKMEDPGLTKEELEDLQPKIKLLELYYTGNAWKEDFSLDEEGKLPKDLKRGVLSEDAIYNILEKNREMMEEPMIWDFEDLHTVGTEKEVAILLGMDPEMIVKAYMGTSPENAAWLEKNLPDVDFKGIRERLGRQPIVEIEKAQGYILDCLFRY